MMTKRHHVCDESCKKEETKETIMKRIHDLQQYHWEVQLRNSEE